MTRAPTGRDTCDHRALDGARAAQFLGALAELVEEPLSLLV